MPQKKNFLPPFLILFAFAILLFILSRLGFLNGVTGFFEQVTVPLQKFTFNIFHKEDNTENARLREDNSQLTAQLVDKIKQERENQALRDQFETTYPKATSLLPAKIIGMTGDEITLDKGQKDGIKVDFVVVYKNNLIGKIIKTSSHASVVNVITHNTSLTAKTLKTQSQGIVKSQGGNLILDNVVLTDKLEKEDFVVTKGNMDSEGNGFPPDLVIGKIITVAKKASSLFQSASVKSLVDFSKLEMVFVIMNHE